MHRSLRIFPILLAGALPLVGAPAGELQAARPNARMGARLQHLVAAYQAGGEAAVRRFGAERQLRLRESRLGPWVPIVLEPRGTSARELDLAAVEERGARVDAVSDSFVRVLARPADIPRLATLADVRVVRTPTPARALGVGEGRVVSESVSLTGAAALQQVGFTGGGVRVAVVDLGFQGLGAAIAAGELPRSTRAVDFTGTGVERDTEHGVAVAEEIADMAPGVSLTCIKIGDEVDLENAAAYLRATGIRIANHSVGWVLASYYDDTGPINGIVNRSHDQDGVLWTVAAGNSALSHWRGAWVDADHDERLDFAPGENALDITNPDGFVSVFLNWNQYGHSITDLDLYVRDRNGAIVASSTDPQTGAQDPAEEVSFRYDAARAPYRAEVVHHAGPVDGLDVTLFSFDDDFARPSAGSSVMDPADAHGALAVGAIAASRYALASGVAPESYSSQGPTTDGRLKPDLCAPDGTSTFTYGLRASYGTSFSAPVAAGAAALWLQASPGLDAAGLAQALLTQAADVGPPGADSLCGAGRLELVVPSSSAPICSAGCSPAPPLRHVRRRSPRSR
jgi:hypothetical protein